MQEDSEPVDILLLPLEQLQLSSYCTNYSKTLGFKTLRDITERGWGGLQSMEGFSYIWFNELAKFLEDHHLLYLLEK